MPLKNDRYTYRITWPEDDQEYVGLCAEFPSLSWLDKTPESALKGIRVIVESVIKNMTHGGGEEIPQPIACKRYSGKFMYGTRPSLSSQKSCHPGIGIRCQPKPDCWFEVKSIAV